VGRVEGEASVQGEGEGGKEGREGGGEGGAATQGEDKSEVQGLVAVSDLVPIVLVAQLRPPFQRSLRGSRPGWETGRPLWGRPWCLFQCRF
jgi:hypothetical protein